MFTGSFPCKTQSWRAAEDRDVRCGPHSNASMERANPNHQHAATGQGLSPDTAEQAFSPPALLPLFRVFPNCSKPLPRLTTCVRSSHIPYTHGPQRYYLLVQLSTL